MVKLGFYVVRTKGKKGVGQYDVILLRFPKELHGFLRCLNHRQLEIRATREGNVTHIMLIEKQKPQ